MTHKEINYLLFKRKTGKKIEIITHDTINTKIAEISTVAMVLKTTDDGLDILGNLYFQGFDKIIIHEKNITPDFFDLKQRLQAISFKNLCNIVCL